MIRVVRGKDRFGNMKKKLAFLFFALCALGIVTYFTHPLYLPLLAEFLIQADPLEKADAIIVLGGDDISGSRVLEAVSLLREGWAEVLIVSGTPIAWGVHSADVTRKQAEELGVPPAKIFTVPRTISGSQAPLVDSTLSEAHLLLAECKQRGYQTLIVVTSNFHTRRAKRILAHVFSGSGIRVLIHPSASTVFRVDRWWTRRSDARAWFLEMQKLVFSYLELN